MDFGCTFYMTPNKEYFSTYQSVEGGVVLMGSSNPIVGIGLVKIQMYYDIVRTLTEVRYILKLKKSLISLSTLDDEGL